MCTTKDYGLFCMKQPLSLIYTLYFQKCNNHVASFKQEIFTSSKKLRYAIHAGEQKNTFRSRKVISAMATSNT